MHKCSAESVNDGICERSHSQAVRSVPKLIDAVQQQLLGFQDYLQYFVVHCDSWSVFNLYW